MLLDHKRSGLPREQQAIVHLRDPWSFLETGFVGQCEVFVCLGFV